MLIAFRRIFIVPWNWSEFVWKQQIGQSLPFYFSSFLVLPKFLVFWKSSWCHSLIRMHFQFDPLNALIHILLIWSWFKVALSNFVRALCLLTTRYCTHLNAFLMSFRRKAMDLIYDTPSKCINRFKLPFCIMRFTGISTRIKLLGNIWKEVSCMWRYVKRPYTSFSMVQFLIFQFAKSIELAEMSPSSNIYALIVFSQVSSRSNGFWLFAIKLMEAIPFDKLCNGDKPPIPSNGEDFAKTPNSSQLQIKLILSYLLRQFCFF